MNQHFNISRFGLLLRKHVGEHMRSYLMGTGVLAGVLALALGGLTYLARQPLEANTQVALFSFFLMLSGAVFTSTVFEALGDQRRAVPALLLPASHLEKYLVVWLLSLPVFLVVFTAVFFAVDALTIQLAGGIVSGLLLDFSNRPGDLNSILLYFALVHGVSLWGAIYFQRLHVIRTAFTAFGLLAVCSVLNFQVLKGLLSPDIRFAPPFADMTLREGDQVFSLALGNSQTALFGILALALAVLFWLSAYARLNEKQL
ncbi:hypothetical protein [Hymenobacter arizonensis]|uniref:ABC-2 type transport system permease protein n=1 Tax=Hymenobacter arizonensis TaxID=1227077 RepID=A0A1I6B044_HYMAR|nr:hypothetical protein [Hymenobacter arizonensis]SFQ74249.1 hypothetical protein SAMN04515668_4107 [Hymenobacter arizonensis]